MLAPADALPASSCVDIISQQLSATVVNVTLKLVAEALAFDPVASGCPVCLTPVYTKAPTSIVAEEDKLTTRLFEPPTGAANPYEY